MPTHGKTLVNDCIVAIGPSNPGEDWRIAPTMHADALDDSAPKLAAVLRENRIAVTAKQYERADHEANLARDEFKSAARKSSRCVFAVGALGALLLITGIFFPASTDEEGSQDVPQTVSWSESIGRGGRPTYLILGVLSIVIGSMATVFITRVRRGQLLQTWFQRRAEAERRRLEYFGAVVAPQGSATDSELNLLKLEYLRRYLLESQIAYFDKRGREHAGLSDRNTRLAATASGVAAGATGLAGFLAVVVEPKLSAISAAGVIASGYVSLRSQYEEIDQNSRNAERYRNTQMLLEDLSKKQIDKVRELLADEPTTAAVPLDVFNGAVAKVLMDEHSQWLDSKTAIEAMIDDLERDLERFQSEVGPSAPEDSEGA